jgi:2-C-methyl-D-erythritol 4-phosphate cytidylyltransferase
MVEWSLDAFDASPAVGEIVVMVPPGAEPPAGLAERAKLVEGGAARSESVRNGLDAVAAEIVAVHDAARPLVRPELIDALVEELWTRPDADAVVAAAPLADTVKRATATADPSPAVAETVSRDGLWAAQTPQVFRAGKLREAIDADPRQLATATDDAWLVEQAGGTVLLHRSPSENFKVTTPTDLRIAELLLVRS